MDCVVFTGVFNVTDDGRQSDFEPVVDAAMLTPVPELDRGNLGRQVASLGAVAMLIGIALAVHTWMPPGWERTALIMSVSGVAVWVLAAFALHLGSERAPLLVMLFPTVIFLGVMIAVLAFAQSDFPEGFERIDHPVTDEAH